MKTKSETEFKLQSAVNLQFKFGLIDKHKMFEDRARLVCEWLGIKCAKSFCEKITDEYFDDESLNIRRAGYSLRFRKEGKASKFTLKGISKKELSQTPMIRDEHERTIDRSSFLKMINSDNGVTKLVDDAFGAIVKCGPCSPVLLVSNDRTSMPIRSNIASYILSYDTFYYWHDHQYSEVFLEVEIELKKGTVRKDKQIKQLVKSFEVLFNYKPTDQSKFERGIAWKLNPDHGVQTIYTLMMDIIGYSKQTAAVQKQMVQILSKATRDCVNKFRSADDITHIPTGDGMILVFDDHPEQVVPIAFGIQDKLHQSKQQGNVNVELRIGLHSGPIFRYTDVNGNQNFAGSGINLAQRVMSLGGAGHILATADAFRSMGEIDDGLKEFFHLVGERAIKHGERITVYNVFDPNGNHGNPKTPDDD